MVELNTRYLTTLSARGKFFTILIGVISIGFGGHAYDKSFYNIIWKLADTHDIAKLPKGVFSILTSPIREECFLSIVGILLVFSVISLLCQILNGELSNSKINKVIDIGVHVLGVGLQITAGCLIILSAVKIGNHCEEEDFQNILKKMDLDITCQYSVEKVLAGAFAILNAFAFAFVAFIGVRRFNTKLVLPTSH